MLWRAPVILCQLRSGFARKGAALTIHELRVRSNEFVANLDQHIAAVVNFNEDLEELNRKQLKDNRRADDTAISPDYSPLYADWKRTFHPQSYGDGRVNLFLSGDFYKSLEIRARGDEYLITSDISYALKLARKYGNITGISPKSQPAAQKIVVPLLREKFRQTVLS